MKTIRMLLAVCLVVCISVTSVQASFVYGQTLTSTHSDNFTRANETPLTNGGNWGTMNTFSKPNLTSNFIVPPTGGSAFIALWTGNAWANDQYSQVTLNAFGGNSDQIYAIVRGSTSATTMYRGMVTKSPSGGVFEIDKFVTGTQTTLVSNAGVAVSASDRIALSVIGITLYLFHNEALVASAQDSAIASGNAGVGMFAGSGTTGIKISAWEAGTVTNGGNSSPQPVAVNLAGGTKGIAYSETITVVGGVIPINYAVTSGALPTSLSLNTSTGVISGTPTVNGTYTFTITATDNNGNTGSQSFQIIVVAATSGGSFAWTG